MATLYFILLGYDKGPHLEREHSGAFYAERPRKSEVRDLLDEAILASLESDEETGSSESDEELASTSNSQRRKRNRSPQEPTKDEGENQRHSQRRRLDDSPSGQDSQSPVPILEPVDQLDSDDDCPYIIDTPVGECIVTCF